MFSTVTPFRQTWIWQCVSSASCRCVYTECSLLRHWRFHNTLSPCQNKSRSQNSKKCRLRDEGNKVKVLAQRNHSSTEWERQTSELRHSKLRPLHSRLCPQFVTIFNTEVNSFLQGVHDVTVIQVQMRHRNLVPPPNGILPQKVHPSWWRRLLNPLRK